MLEISRTALFGKLNPVAYKAIEGATVFCKLRGNPYVELQHWLYQILNAQDSDLHRIVKHYGLDASVLAGDLMAALDRLPRGAS
jgi:type VI secretion system protein VasG